MLMATTIILRLIDTVVKFTCNDSTSISGVCRQANAANGRLEADRRHFEDEKKARVSTSKQLTL